MYFPVTRKPPGSGMAVPNGASTPEMTGSRSPPYIRSMAPWPTVTAVTAALNMWTK